MNVSLANGNLSFVSLLDGLEAIRQGYAARLQAVLVWLCAVDGCL